MPTALKMIRRPAQRAALLEQGCVGTIGTFDGVHIGHQRILGQVLDKAKAMNLPSVVISFEPTPREFFTRGVPPARLTRLREKIVEFSRLGIDLFYCPPFDATMERLEPDEFITGLLVEQLNIRHLVVGDDFVFGHARSGSIADLQRAGPDYGFTVEQAQTVMAKGQRVSSTLIRQALIEGEMSTAAALLGRPYAMTGRVVGGKKLGKELGYPTANVNLNRRTSPIAGIFAVRVAGPDAQLLDGVASVGTRPTIGGTDPLLEVHIFDFDRDIYGDYIRVEFIGKLRDEVHFEDLDALIEQMHIDARQARQMLAG